MSTWKLFLLSSVIASVNLYSEEKGRSVDIAIALLGQWRSERIDSVEQKIESMEDVDALRIIAFASRSAAFPEMAENIEIDARLNRVFWASIRALCKIETENAKAARRVIWDSGLIQGGDRILFKQLEDRVKDVRP